MRNLFRKTPPPPVIDEAVYERWLRAQRPPLDWFAELEEAEQEVFAALGDAQAEDLLVATGFAVADPEKVRLGLAAADGDDEAIEELTIRKAEQLAARSQTPQNVPQATPLSAPVSMGGMGQRRQEAEDRRQAGRVVPTLFGKAADPEPEELTG